MTINFQAGITDPPPEHVVVTALNFVLRDQVNAQSALNSLQTLIRRELAADLDEIDPQSDPTAATADAGELGVVTDYDTTNLTITMGMALSAFQILGVAPALLPADLITIDWNSFTDIPQNPNQGDLVLQFCADSSYIVEHVLRRIEHTLGASFSVVWTLAGEQRNGASHGGPLTRGSARGLIGFHDGLSNLDPCNPADQQLIFVGQPGAPACPPPPPPGPQPAPGPGQPGYNTPGAQPPIFPSGLRPPPGAEPPWTTDGTYLMIRASLFNTVSWDELSLQSQQQAVGRWKYSGATLDNPNQVANRSDAPGFATTPSEVQVPLTSHIRRANPRALATDPDRRIFRRGYPIILPSTQGALQRGLLFIAFGRSLSTQVEFIMRAWLKNPNFPSPGAGVDPILSIGSQVLAGGYYFVPPVVDPSQPWNWALPIAM